MATLTIVLHTSRGGHRFPKELAAEGRNLGLRVSLETFGDRRTKDHIMAVIGTDEQVALFRWLMDEWVARESPDLVQPYLSGDAKDMRH